MSFLAGDAGKRADKAADKQRDANYKSGKQWRNYNMETEQLGYNHEVLSNEIQKRNLEE